MISLSNRAARSAHSISCATIIGTGEKHDNVGQMECLARDPGVNYHDSLHTPRYDYLHYLHRLHAFPNLVGKQIVAYACVCASINRAHQFIYLLSAESSAKEAEEKARRRNQLFLPASPPQFTPIPTLACP